jgi:signal transduction histidine kinase
VTVSGEILAARRQYALRVADKGRGIPADQVAALLGRSQQGSPAADQAGPAMNLLVVRRLVELHQGEFSVQSQPGRKTVVEASLPLAGATPVG